MVESKAFNLLPGNETVSENVRYEVYLNANEKKITSDIDSDEQKLFMSITVENEGRIENAKINIENANFDIKDNPGIHEFSIDAISAGNTRIIELPIVVRKSSNFNLSLLNMTSQIILTGEYIDSQGNVTDLDEAKEVSIIWTTDKFTEEQVQVSQELIANGKYTVGGEEKRVVQVLVKTKLQDNVSPVYAETLEIYNPRFVLSNGDTKTVEPETVRVAAKSTKATNGLNNPTFLEVNSETPQEEIDSNDNQYEYSSEDGMTLIVVLNYGNENVVSWDTNSQNEYVITYVYPYDNSLDIESVYSNVNDTFYLYGRTDPENDTIEKDSSESLGELVSHNDLASINKAYSPNEIYKGYMYAKQDTYYNTKLDVFVSYVDPIEELRINDSETIYTSQGDLPAYYSKTIINREQALNLLGDEGIINIYDADNLEYEPVEIYLAEDISNDYYEIIYSENINRLLIQTSKPIKEGKLEIENEKKIVVNEVNEVVRSAERLSTVPSLSLFNDEREEPFNMKSITGAIELKEPTTKVNLSINKDTISSQIEEVLKITTTFRTLNPSDKLFKNPSLYIELPNEITEAQIENVTLSDGELSVKSYEIRQTESGAKVLVVELEGEQTRYSQNEALGGDTLVIDLKVRTNNFMADKNTSFKSVCTNDEERIDLGEQNLKITSKQGLITKNYLRIEDTEIEKLNENRLNGIVDKNNQIEIRTQIINNTGEDLSNVILQAQIPDGFILLSDENSTRVEMETFANGDMVEITYTLQAPESLKELEDIIQSTISIEYILNNMPKEEIIIYEFTKVEEEVPEEPQEPEQPEQPEGPQDPQEPEEPEEPEEPIHEETFSASLSLKQKTQTETLYQGQIVTYIVSAKNTGDTTINNAKMQYLIPEGAVYAEYAYTEEEEAHFEYDERKSIQEWNIEKLEPGEEITKEVTIKINDGTTKILNVARLLNKDNNIEKEVKFENNVIKGELVVTLTRRDNPDVVYCEGDSIRYIITVLNNTGSTMNNIVVKGNIPEHTEFEDGKIYNKDWSFNANDNAAYYNISELEQGQSIELSYVVKVQRYPQDVREAIIDNIVLAKAQNGEQYESNVCTAKVQTIRWSIEQRSEHEEILRYGDTAKYIIYVRNDGLDEKAVNIFDKIPDEIQVRYAKLLINNEVISERDVFTDNEVKFTQVLEPGQELVIEIEGIVLDLEDKEEVEITNVAKILIEDGQYQESNKITNKIVNDEPDEPEKPEEPKTYSISGLAWFDENRNGKMDEGEEVLKEIRVILLDEQGIAKDEDGNNIETRTTINGTYKFSNLKPGKYIVAFEYDDTKYQITKYQVKDATEENNSDAMQRNIVVDGKELKTGITDILEIKENDIANINIGLSGIAHFDLKLDKYISKVVITTAQGATTTYEFLDNVNFTKVEIGASKFAGSTVLVEYNIEITNEGDVDGYIGDIIDYMPKGMTFSSELNTNWYLAGDQNLHYTQLDLPPIKPGSTQKVKLVLAKTLSSNSAGTIENVSEIGNSSNLEGIAEIDSIANNKKANEDDISTASLIVSIATGSPTMYIGIVLISLMIIGTGIFLINKKVIEGGISNENENSL